MRKFFRDALNAALQKLGFPFLTPHPTKTGKEVGYFQKVISDNDLYQMYKRNQLAHNIVFNVAQDALASGFVCTTPKGKDDEEFNSAVQQLYEDRIHYPFLKAFFQARLYGSAGLLLGYRDSNGFASPADPKDKIDYCFALPRKWISRRVPRKDSSGYAVVPLELSHYELNSLFCSSSQIDASRLVHIQPLSIEDDFLGESALYCVFDVLTVLKNMDWSVGQAMFRHGAGLTTVVAGDGASQAQIDAIDDVVSEINAKTVLTLPPGCKLSTERPGALDPEKYYNVIMNQIAGGSNIPISILVGAQKGGVEASSKDRKDYSEFLSAIQKHTLTPSLKEIIKRFQASGQLPDAEFRIDWHSPSIFLIDIARGKLYEARAEHEHAKAEAVVIHSYIDQLEAFQRETSLIGQLPEGEKSFKQTWENLRIEGMKIENEKKKVYLKLARQKLEGKQKT